MIKIRENKKNRTNKLFWTSAGLSILLFFVVGISSLLIVNNASKKLIDFNKKRDAEFGIVYNFVETNQEAIFDTDYSELVGKEEASNFNGFNKVEYCYDYLTLVWEVYYSGSANASQSYLDSLNENFAVYRSFNALVKLANDKVNDYAYNISTKDKVMQTYDLVENLNDYLDKFEK